MSEPNHAIVSKQLSWVSRFVLKPETKTPPRWAARRGQDELIRGADYFASDRFAFTKSQFSSSLMKVSMYFGRAFWVSR